MLRRLLLFTPLSHHHQHRLFNAKFPMCSITVGFFRHFRFAVLREKQDRQQQVVAVCHFFR